MASQLGRQAFQHRYHTTASTLFFTLLVTFLESPFLKQAFEGEYPKLLRLYNELWTRLQQFVTKSNTNNVYTGNVGEVVYGLFHLYQDTDERFVYATYCTNV